MSLEEKQTREKLDEAENDIDLLSYHEHGAGRLVIDPE
jgi:hypothetical protein